MECNNFPNKRISLGFACTWVVQLKLDFIITQFHFACQESSAISKPHIKRTTMSNIHQLYQVQLLKCLHFHQFEGLFQINLSLSLPSKMSTKDTLELVSILCRLSIFLRIMFSSYDKYDTLASYDSQSGLSWNSKITSIYAKASHTRDQLGKALGPFCGCHDIQRYWHIWSLMMPSFGSRSQFFA